MNCSCPNCSFHRERKEHPEDPTHFTQVQIKELAHHLEDAIKHRQIGLDAGAQSVDLEEANLKIKSTCKAILALLKIPILCFFLVGCGDAFDSTRPEFTKLDPDATGTGGMAGLGGVSEASSGAGGIGGAGGSVGNGGNSGGISSVGGNSGSAGSAGAPTGGAGGSGGGLTDAGSVCQPAVNDPGTLCPSGKQTWVCGGYVPVNCASSGLSCCVCCDGEPIE